MYIYITLFLPSMQRGFYGAGPSSRRIKTNATRQPCQKKKRYVGMYCFTGKTPHVVTGEYAVFESSLNGWGRALLSSETAGNPSGKPLTSGGGGGGGGEERSRI